MNKEGNDNSESVLKSFQAGKYLEPVDHVLNDIKQKEYVQLPVGWNSSSEIHDRKYDSLSYSQWDLTKPRQVSDEILVCWQNQKSVLSIIICSISKVTAHTLFAGIHFV